MKTTFTFLIILFFTICSSFSNNLIEINFIDDTSESYRFTDIKEINFVEDLIPVKSFTLDFSTAELKVGDSLQISYTILPEDASNKNVIWTSSNENVASVSDDGMIKANEIGQSTITGRTESGQLQEQIEVEVQSINSISISKDELKIYPNPTQDRIFVDIPNNYSYEVVITNLKGHVIYSAYDVNEIGMQRFSAGTYFVTVVINNSYFNYQIIKN